MTNPASSAAAARASPPQQPVAAAGDAGGCPVTTDAMFQDLLSMGAQLDIAAAISSINDVDTTQAAKREGSDNSDFPSPSIFMPSPATMMGIELQASIAMETDNITEVAVVPDVDDSKAAAAAAQQQQQQAAANANVFTMGDVSVQDLAAIFARDPAAMQLAQTLCKAPVVLNENPALKKKRAKKVPVKVKDAKYYERRRKNTAAAKRNRDLKKAKRLLERDQARARMALMSKLTVTA